jgi:hypothetical protein
MVLGHQDSHIFWNLLTDGVEVVSLTRSPAAVYTSGRFLVLITARGRVYPMAIVLIEQLSKSEKKINNFVFGTRDLPACSIVRQLVWSYGISCGIALAVNLQLRNRGSISFFPTSLRPVVGTRPASRPMGNGDKLSERESDHLRRPEDVNYGVLPPLLRTSVRLGSIPGSAWFSSSSIAYRPALGPTQPHILVPWFLSPGVKRQGREAEHLHRFSTVVNHVRAIPPLPHTSSLHSA